MFDLADLEIAEQFDNLQEVIDNRKAQEDKREQTLILAHDLLEQGKTIAQVIKETELSYYKVQKIKAEIKANTNKDLLDQKIKEESDKGISHTTIAKENGVPYSSVNSKNKPTTVADVILAHLTEFAPNSLRKNDIVNFCKRKSRTDNIPKLGNQPAITSALGTLVKNGSIIRVTDKHGHYALSDHFK